jgi:hypothetical protein
LYADEAYEAHIANYATHAYKADHAFESQKALRANSAINAVSANVSGSGTTSFSPVHSSATYPGDGSTHNGLSTQPVLEGAQLMNTDPKFYYGVGHNVVGEDSSGIVWTVRAPDSDGQRQVPPGYVDSSGREDLPEGSTTQFIMHERTRNGIKKVMIDPNDSLKEKIGKILYKDYFSHDPSMPEVRSKLRSFNLYSNANSAHRSCLEELMKQGRLSVYYKSPAPGTIVNTVSRDSEIRRFGKTSLGNPNETRSKSFKFNVSSVSGDRYYVQDPQYSVDARIRNTYESFNSGTHLSKTVTVGKFFGGPGNANAFSKIVGRVKREEILYNLQEHANIIEMVNDNANFAGYTLVVSEGVYIPSSSAEKSEIDNGSVNGNWANWNKYKSKGEAIVYQLIGTDGLIAWDKTFELVTWLREHIVYEELAIDYDTFNYDATKTVQIIIHIPTSRNRSASKIFNPLYKLSTWWNGKRQSSTSLIKFENPYIDSDDLIEATPSPINRSDIIVTPVGFSSELSSDPAIKSWSGTSFNKSHNSTGSVVLEFSTPVSVTISGQISSEQGFDRGLVYVNGELTDASAEDKFSGSLSQNQGSDYYHHIYEAETYENVSELKFEYVKDGSVSRGDDELTMEVTWS